MHRLHRVTRLICLSAATLVLLASASAQAADPDWTAVADVDTIYVLTTDSDGDTRETKIWMAVLDGTAYVRTSRSTTWGDNVERESDIGIRVEDTDYAVRATFIEAADERARIIAGFEEKYGSNMFLNWIRGDDPRIMRLDSR